MQYTTFKIAANTYKQNKKTNNNKKLVFKIAEVRNLECSYTFRCPERGFQELGLWGQQGLSPS